MHTHDGERFYVKKGRGLVSDVFGEEHFARLKGRVAVGHGRYATAGSGDDRDIQPFYESSRIAMSMAHNGNLTNFADIKRRFGNFASDCDLEGVLKVAHTHLVSESMKREMLAEIGRLEANSASDIRAALSSLELSSRVDTASDVTIDLLFGAVRNVMDVCQGSYSVIAYIPGVGLLGFKDPYGIKPLVVGVKSTDKGPSYAFASEDVAFQLPLGYDFIKEIGPGSAFLARDDGRVIERTIVDGFPHSPCIFEWIYFASEASRIGGVSVSEFRYQLGKENGRQYLERVPRDVGRVICSYIPSSPERGAEGFSHVTGIPRRKLVIRNNYMKRGFILPDKHSREENSMLKLPIDFSVLEDVDTLIILDDSIVRGDTSMSFISRLRSEAAKRELPLKNIYMVVLAPPNRYGCYYGIDMAVRQELIASRLGSVEAVKEHIGVDYLQYQELDTLGKVLWKLTGRPGVTYCDACFSGNYPTGLTMADIERVENERLADKGSDY
jgi:amidophosphoribosyltransferase